MDAVNDIATPSFDFFPIISVIPLFESVSLYFLSSTATIVHSSLLFLPLYTVRREKLNVLTNKLLSNHVQVFSAHPVQFSKYLDLRLPSTF